jgi:hypothetical protein
MKNEGVRVLVRFRPPREGAEPSEMSVTTSDDRTAVLRCVGARPHCHILCSHQTHPHTTKYRIRAFSFLRWGPHPPLDARLLQEPEAPGSAHQLPGRSSVWPRVTARRDL